MKVSSANRDENSYFYPKESDMNANLQKNVNHHKMNSDNLINNVSIDTDRTSNTNTNVILKAKRRVPGGNSSANIFLFANPNEKEKGSISSNNLASNFINNKNSNNAFNANMSSFKSNNDIAKRKRNVSAAQMPNFNCRRDAKGTPILKGRKNHKITFRDYLDNDSKLTDVVKIESYKEYNAKEIDSKELKKTGTDDNTSCACTIF